MESLKRNLSGLHLSLEVGDKIPSAQILTEAVATMQFTENGTLCLSRKKLQHISDCVLKISQIKNLYLEGNEISSLPDNLFSSLSNLVWLDLRNNQVTYLPPEIGQHRFLKTLLLEGNPITELPLELGNLITLRALSLRHCPITFPPQEIVHQGLQCILQFLRSAMAERPVSVKKRFPVEIPHIEKLTDFRLDFSEEAPDKEEVKKFEELKLKMIQMEGNDFGYGNSALPQSEPFRAAKNEIGAGVHDLPSVKRHYRKRSEERRQAAMKELKEKQAILEQRKKDQELLREWRSQARVMQEFKVSEPRLERGKRDEVARKAPYATDSTYSNGVEILTYDALQQTQEPQSPNSVLQLEESRSARDKELEVRIRTHVRMMQERRWKPKCSIQKEIEETKRQMEEAKKLQSELAELKLERGLEYRFTAFTGENLPRMHDN